MATERFGVAGFTEEARTFYVMQLLNRAMPFLRHAGWGVQRDVPRRQGMSANFRRLEQVPGNVSWIANEGTPPTVTNVTWVSVNATVRQYGAFDYVSDLAWTQSIDDTVGEMGEMFAGQMGRTIDFLARDVMAAGSNVQYATGSSLTAINTSHILTGYMLAEAVAQLKKRGAAPHPRAGGRFATLVNPDVYADLITDSAVSSALQYAAPRGGENPLFTGGEFDFAGARIIEASFARIQPSAGISVNVATYTTLVFGEGYYGEVKLAADGTDIIVKDYTEGGPTNPLNQYGSVGWKTSYGVVRLNEAFCQRIETAATKNDTSALPYPEA